MGRKGKTVYEKIVEITGKIEGLEIELSQSNAYLIELLKEKDELEMRETWNLIKEKGLSVEDVQKILAKQKTV